MHCVCVHVRLCHIHHSYLCDVTQCAGCKAMYIIPRQVSPARFCLVRFSGLVGATLIVRSRQHGVRSNCLEGGSSPAGCLFCAERQSQVGPGARDIVASWQMYWLCPICLAHMCSHNCLCLVGMCFMGHACIRAVILRALAAQGVKHVLHAPYTTVTCCFHFMPRCKLGAMQLPLLHVDRAVRTYSIPVSYLHR